MVGLEGLDGAAVAQDVAVSRQIVVVIPDRTSRFRLDPTRDQSVVPARPPEVSSPAVSVIGSWLSVPRSSTAPIMARWFAWHDFSSAINRDCRKIGTAIVTSIPMMSTTTISSTRVKPESRLFHPRMPRPSSMRLSASARLDCPAMPLKDCTMPTIGCPGVRKGRRDSSPPPCHSHTRTNNRLREQVVAVGGGTVPFAGQRALVAGDSDGVVDPIDARRRGAMRNGLDDSRAARK